MGDWLSHNDGYDALGVQELGGLPEFDSPQPGTLKEIRNPEYNELEDYHVFVVPAHSIESHLSQGILLESSSVNMVHRTYAGKRAVGVLARHVSGLDVWYVSVHLPHCSDTDEEYACALAELQLLIQNNADIPFVVMGDFNTFPFENAGGNTGRSDSLQAALGQHGLLCIRSGSPTWHGRRSQSELDFFFVSSKLVQRAVGSITGFDVAIHQGARDELRSLPAQGTGCQAA